MENQIKYILAVLLLSVSFLFGINLETDLEDDKQEWVLETKQISIPGFPHAYNPSIIPWHQGYLMTFRITPNLKSRFESHIGVVLLSDNFDIISDPQILVMNGDCLPIPPRSEDPRLIYVQDKLYLVYSDNKEEKITRGGFRVYLAELKHNEHFFYIENIQGIFTFPDVSLSVREKNWTPFVYDDELYLAYKLVPHIVLKPILGTSLAHHAHQSYPQIDWKWGELRGGTPALLVNGQYLSFFHSSIDIETVHSHGKKLSHYFMGAYTFSPSPPFYITSLSPSPIIGKGFYHGKEYPPYWKPVKAIFPCGFVFDQNFIWIAYGRDDHEVWIVKLDKNKLLKSLIPVYSD